MEGRCAYCWAQPAGGAPWRAGAAVRQRLTEGSAQGGRTSTDVARDAPTAGAFLSVLGSPCAPWWLSRAGNRERTPCWNGNRPQRCWPLGDRLSPQGHPLRSDPEVRRLILLATGARPGWTSGHLFSPRETPGSLGSHMWKVPRGSKRQDLTQAFSSSTGITR